MADVKISGLPAATTPLAGTEVLPIVQSSTTVKATIANVQAAPIAAQTADRMLFLNASKVPSTSNNATFDGTSFGLGASPAVYGGRLAVGGHIAIASGNSLKLWNTAGTGVGGISSPDTNTLAFGLGGSFTESMRLTSTGLGIGTTAPTVKLEVGNGTGLQQAVISGGGYNLVLGASGGAIFGFTSQNISTVFNTASVPLGVGTNAAQPLIFGASNTERMRIGSTGTISLGAAPGAESLRVTPVVSAVNYVQVEGASGISPIISAQGSGADLNLSYASKGTGSHYFRLQGTSGAVVFEINPGTSTAVVNGFRMYPAISGNSPTFEVSGADTNLDIIFRAKGTGGMLFRNAANATQFAVSSTASAVNYIQVNGATTGSDATLRFTGSDTNVGGIYAAKGAGSHRFFTNDNNQQQFQISHTSSAVNYLQVTGAATGGSPFILPTGSDANISLTLYTKGTSPFTFATNSGNEQFRISHVASAVNYLRVTGGATGVAPVVSAQGSDTNIDLALTPKGTGVLAFGTYTAGILAQAGYIQIKDAAGNTRNLLVG